MPVSFQISLGELRGPMIDELPAELRSIVSVLLGLWRPPDASEVAALNAFCDENKVGYKDFTRDGSLLYTSIGKQRHHNGHTFVFPEVTRGLYTVHVRHDGPDKCTVHISGQGHTRVVQPWRKAGDRARTVDRMMIALRLDFRASRVR